MTTPPSDNQDVFSIAEEDRVRLAPVLRKNVILCENYWLDKQLASDEQGETWIASDLRNKQSVIIYLPPEDIRKNRETAKPIRRAAKHAAALKHPQIVPIVEYLVDPDHGFFVVRKFIDGSSLDIYREKLARQRKKLPPDKIFAILTPVAQALDYMHRVSIVSDDKVRSVGVIHGCLCPKDVLISLTGEVYLDNFIVAPAVIAGAQVHESPERKPYLAPEVAAGEPATAQSDIYSLAAIAYELFAGRVPFESDNEAKSGILCPIPEIPGMVDVVLRKALANSPSGRHDTCGALVRELAFCFQDTA